MWVDSVDLAVERVKQRVAEGGHHVPEDVVRRRYLRGAQNFFALYRPVADTWAVWENANDKVPQRIAFGSVADGATILQPDRWARLARLAA